MASPSAAYADFQTSLIAATRLARIESRYTDPPRSAMAQTVQALRGGYSVLIVGSFESYVSAAFSEHLNPLAAAPPPVPFSQLPEKLRLTSVFESLQHATTGPRHGAAKNRKGRYSDVAAAARMVADERIDPSALGRTKGNPDSTRLKEMFKAIGVKDVFGATRSDFDAAWSRPESFSFVSDKLDEIVNARHVVAHTANALAISRTNLSEWGPFLEALALALDKRLDQYASNVLNRVNPP